MWTSLAFAAFSAWAQMDPDESQALFRAKGIVIRRQEYHRIGGKQVPCNVLLCGGILWGFNYLKPDNRADWGQPDLDFSRLATSYYHRRGPAGLVLEKFNWFSGAWKGKTLPPNTFWADARLPASLVGMGGLSGLAPLPLEQLGDLWSEPPFAALGLGAGTLASYARPGQYVHFYESEARLIGFSLPPAGKRSYFNYVADALARGANVQVFPGEERQTLAAKGPQNFYHALFVEMSERNWSTTVKVHLLTKEAMAMCFEKLTTDGLLCIHTSHRFVNAPSPIAAVAKDLGFACLRSYDEAPEETKDDFSHFTSNWVIIARKPEYLNFLHQVVPSDYQQKLWDQNKRSGLRGEPDPYWSVPPATFRRVLTDKEHSLAGLYRGDPTVSGMRDSFESVYYKVLWPFYGGKAYELSRNLSHSLFQPLEEAVVKLRNRGQ